MTQEPATPLPLSRAILHCLEIGWRHHVARRAAKEYV